MINLLYHSHTVVPAHLEELEGLGVLESGEQVLVALDGVLQDGTGRRVSGPTLHDYCLLTSLRIVLWARDYGRHLCYAFPLTELSMVEGVGTDPLHAQVQFTFAASNAEEQRFILALLPLRDLNAAVALFHLAGEAAQEFGAEGMSPYEAGPEIAAALAEHVYGAVDGRLPSEMPYRWPGSGTQPFYGGDSAFHNDPASLPPEQIYAAGRLARSAWDTLRRTLREELPFELNGGSLRDLADTVRAINELVNTVASNPTAREMAMAFLSRRGSKGGGERQPAVGAQRNAPDEEPVEEAMAGAAPAAPTPREYREIPLRRRGEPTIITSFPGPAAPVERTEIPLRQRTAAHRPPIAMSGSGDAGKSEKER